MLGISMTYKHTTINEGSVQLIAAVPRSHSRISKLVTDSSLRSGLRLNYTDSESTPRSTESSEEFAATRVKQR
jgi:hypothetical protein